MKNLILFLLLAFATNAFAQEQTMDSLTVLNKDVSLNYTKSVVVDDGSALTVCLTFVMKNKASYKSIYYYGKKMNKAHFFTYNKINDTHWLGGDFRTGKSFISIKPPKEAVIRLDYVINKKIKKIEITLDKLKKEAPKRMPSRPLK